MGGESRHQAERPSLTCRTATRGGPTVHSEASVAIPLRLATGGFLFPPGAPVDITTMKNAATSGTLPGRTLAIGDVHGCSTSLDKLLDAVGPVSGDVLIFLGDYVGKGPDSAGVLDRLVALSADHQVVPLLGNQEELMLAALRRPARLAQWPAASRDSTLRSYGDDLANVPEAHTKFLEACRRFHETDSHIFVHAGVDEDRPMSRQRGLTLRWKRFDPRQRPHQSGKVVVCGHAAQKTGQPTFIGHAVCIDTYCWGGGWLTCLDVGTGHLWQASETGRLRSAWLDDLERVPTEPVAQGVGHTSTQPTVTTDSRGIPDESVRRMKALRLSEGAS